MSWYVFCWAFLIATMTQTGVLQHINTALFHTTKPYKQSPAGFRNLLNLGAIRQMARFTLNNEPFFFIPHTNVLYDTDHFDCIPQVLTHFLTF